MDSLSIHPRVVKGRQFHPKVNTCVLTQKIGKPGSKIVDRLDRRQKAHELTLKSIRPEEHSAWKKPGSRNPRKLRRGA